RKPSARSGCSSGSITRGRVPRWIGCSMVPRRMWITPWVSHLRKQGVRFHWGARVEKIETAKGRVSGVWLDTGEGRERIEADYYVAALPVERMRTLVSDALKELEPRLAHLD